MLTPDGRIYHQELLDKLNATSKSHLSILKDVLKIHYPKGFGLCAECRNMWSASPKKAGYPCRTVRTIEKRLK